MTSARALLRRARKRFDSPESRLHRLAREAWPGGFASGAEWMRAALGELRGSPPRGPARGLSRLGWSKYGLAFLATLAPLAAAWALESPPLLLACPLAFYAVEVQFLFCFPLALDGCREPLRESRCWTARAGGTLAAMGVAVPLAATMLLGGFLGRGFLRSWCLGGLAVCLWYEDLRRDPRLAGPGLEAPPAGGRRDPAAGRAR